MPTKTKVAAKKPAAKKASPKKVAVKSAPKAKKGLAGVKAELGKGLKVNKSKAKGPTLDLTIETKGEKYEFKKIAPEAIEESIDSLGMTGTNTRTVVIVEGNGKKVEKVLNVHFMRRIFRHSLTRQLFAKTLRTAVGL